MGLRDSHNSGGPKTGATGTTYARHSPFQLPGRCPDQYGTGGFFGQTAAAERDAVSLAVEWWYDFPNLDVIWGIETDSRQRNDGAPGIAAVEGILVAANKYDYHDAPR